MAEASGLFVDCDSLLDVGFAEEAPAWLLASRFFRSKIGGRPSWLNLRDLPSIQDLSCEICQLPRILLCQIYTPLDKDPKAFHRTLFVFMCKSDKCHNVKGKTPFLVLRSQLTRDNEFYPHEPPRESLDWKPELNASKFAGQLCRTCGSKGDKKCSGCGKVNYCHRDHQTADWKARHKTECKDESFTYHFKEDESILENILLPQMELVMAGDDEDVSDTSSVEDGDNVQDIDKEMKKILELEQAGGTLTNADLAQFSTEDEVNKDKNFKMFQKTIKLAPKQVVRYWRNGTPLWVSSDNVPTDIPKCQLCGSKRISEFQIMPQLLAHLKLDKSLSDDTIDWGTLAVFTCEKSCDEPNTAAYKPEFLWKQNMS
jgi:pre-rRNA-processing protein TSR4